MVAFAENLGLGLYTPAEVAMYARVAPSLISRWFFGTRGSRATVNRELAGSDEKVLTFLDFVQALAIRAIRREKKIPLEAIRQTLAMAEQLGVEHPFARSHTVYVLPSKELVLKVPELEDPITSSGPYRGNLTLRRIVEPFLRDLAFDPETKLANRLRVATYPQTEIVMRPGFRFGEPTLTSCGRTARTLWEAYRIEGSAEAAASEHGVSVEDVQAAATYFDSLITVGG